MLTPQTQSNYRVKLRKLRKVLSLPSMNDNNPERAKVLRQIEDLTNKLGMEMTDLEIQLSRRPGRPRVNPLVEAELEGISQAEAEIRRKEALANETPEQRKIRVEATAKAFKEKYEAEHPEIAVENERRKAEQESEAKLQEMIDLANEQLGGSDDNKTTGKTQQGDEGMPKV